MVACPSCGRQNPDDARFCHACAAPLGDRPAAAHEVRKTVTVLFSDVVGSTPLGERLDPESLRRLMARYFDEMRAPLEGHGGTVEKFIGDAVMAVFGVPQLHEDDALRAVRAAFEMRQRLTVLNQELAESYGVDLEMRIGINTGEVVAGAGAATLVTGDAVNLAKRLEQAAGPGEILIGKETYRLVRDEVEAGPLESFAVKGKRDEIAPWRLDELGRTGVTRRQRTTPLVGREAELAALAQDFEEVVAARSCRLVTVLAAAGIGKSRLATEVLAQLGDRATGLTGRCLPYGDGITFWPLGEMVREAGGEPVLRGAVHGLADADLIVERVLGATSSAGEARSGEETFWAVRKLAETLARRRPLVLVFEDIHWAEPTLLDLVEYLAGWIADAPVLLLCLARPDLLDRRPSWLTPQRNARALSIEPLSTQETDLLLEGLGHADGLEENLRERIADAAEGNPLFVEQLVAMVVEEGEEGGRLPMPPSIQALLAARLDRLSREERAVIEAAAVIGREFWRGPIFDLTPTEFRDEIGQHLMSLVRKELISPDTSLFEREDAFRFRHVLIRDAAYDGMPKERRADLHERLVRWIEENAPERVKEQEEIVGYHLEQAYRLRVELGVVDERTRALARRASEVLSSAGRRAFARSDLPAAINLLGRAVELGQADDTSRPLLLRELAAALWAAGDISRAEEILSDALEAAVTVGDRRVEWYARLDHGARRGLTDTDAGAQLGRVAAQAVEVFQELGDDLGLARGWRRLAQVARRGCRFAETQAASERALAHAEAARDSAETAGILDLLCTALLYGPVPADRALARCAEIAAGANGDLLLEANVASSRAGLEAMLGHFEEARALVASAAGVYDELGHRLFRAGLSQVAGPIELLAGRPEAAEQELRHGFEILADKGQTAMLSYPAFLLAETLLAQGRDFEARGFAHIAEEVVSEDDATDQVMVRVVAARLKACDGDLAAAVAEAREAVASAARTDALVLHADALVLLGELLSRSGRPDESREAFKDAVGLYERKGHVVAVRQTVEAVGAASSTRV
ncbi:MAG: zinc-ribbon domain-containing protein [Actinobacteria bacterium]|nr:MAG: zinc-ribbon domain-containing protein [Actinomycetota bacterium]